MKGAVKQLNLLGSAETERSLSCALAESRLAGVAERERALEGTVDAELLVIQGVGGAFTRKIEVVNSEPVYKGLHATPADENDPSWQIWKFTWSSGVLALKQGPLTGSWANRASLGW